MSMLPVTGLTPAYIDIGDADWRCQWCGASFWYGERLKSSRGSVIRFSRCCGEGNVRLQEERDPPDSIKQLFKDKHFMENIRAYNQMFSMTSFGAEIDDTINNGRGPYVFRISGEIRHQIGALCPPDNARPKFLQLYIYDTHNEVANRLHHFGGGNSRSLKPEIVEQLIQILDTHNELVALFRTARDICNENDVPDFTVRLYNVDGARQYDLPSTDILGAIVFESGPETDTEYDVVIQKKGERPQRINKLHSTYMALQFPLLFVYGQPGYTTKLTLETPRPNGEKPKMTMKTYYTYQIHERPHLHGLLFKGGRLFQQYVVSVYCALEQERLDFVRAKQNDIRSEYLSGIYDAISRGDRSGSDIGKRIILPSSFTGGPRYMYSHYLDALAICRVLGNPQFFITFTCNVKWPEIKRYMRSHPDLSPADRADIVDRVFEQKVHDFIGVLKDGSIFGPSAGGTI